MNRTLAPLLHLHARLTLLSRTSLCFFACRRIYQDATAEVKMPVQNPVLQVLSIKATAQTEENKATRYRSACPAVVSIHSECAR